MHKKGEEQFVVASSYFTSASVIFASFLILRYDR